MSGELVNTTELALELGVSRSTVGRWRRNFGLEPDATRGRARLFDLERVRAWMKRVGIDGAHGGDRRTIRTPEAGASLAGPAAGRELEDDGQDDEDDGDLLAGELGEDELEALRVSHLRARIRKERAMADKHELEVAKRRGELVERAEVEAARVERVTYARAVLLGGPGILAGDLVGLGVEAIEERLSSWVRQALGHLQGKQGR